MVLYIYILHKGQERRSSLRRPLQGLLKEKENQTRYDTRFVVPDVLIKSALRSSYYVMFFLASDL